VFTDGTTPYQISDEIKIYQPTGLHGLTLQKTEHIHIQSAGYHAAQHRVHLPADYRISHSTRQIIYIYRLQDITFHTTVYLPTDYRLTHCTMPTYRIQDITFHTTVYLPIDYRISHSTRQIICTYRLQDITFHKTDYIYLQTTGYHIPQDRLYIPTD